MNALLRVLVGLFVVAGAAACGGTSNTSANTASTPATATSPTPEPIVMTRAASVAGVTRTIFTDLKGNTLYYETNDTGGKVNCTGQCAVIWPPLIAPAGESMIPPVFSVPGKFATIADPDGKLQVTYNGWPLFAFSKDPKPGDITGEGVAGRWHAASTDLQPTA